MKRPQRNAYVEGARAADLLRTIFSYMVRPLMCRQQSEQAKATGAGAPSKPVGGHTGDGVAGCRRVVAAGPLASCCTTLHCISSRYTGETSSVPLCQLDRVAMVKRVGQFHSPPHPSAWTSKWTFLLLLAVGGSQYTAPPIGYLHLTVSRAVLGARMKGRTAAVVPTVGHVDSPQRQP